MLKKVAVDKVEIDKLIRLKKYNEAKDFISHIRDVIELVSINRVDVLIKSEVILDTEREGFIKIIQNNIISKLLEEEDYILSDESYVDSIRKRFFKLRKGNIKKRGQMRNKKLHSNC